MLLKDVIQEKFGDDHVIDFTIDEKVEDPKGDRVKITMWKILPYKKW